MEGTLGSRAPAPRLRQGCQLIKALFHFASRFTVLMSTMNYCHTAITTHLDY